MTGTIIRLNSDRGFGFIRGTDRLDYFFHMRDLNPGLTFDNQLLERRVEFNPISCDRGPRAGDVRAAD